MFIKDALSALPSRPVLFIAPLIVVVVLSLYYRDLYNRCAEVRQYRVSLNELLNSTETSARFRLADFTDFEWNKVRIVPQVEPDTISDECPLDWNWASDERDSLIASGLLAALIFGQKGRVVKYFELRGDEVEFRGAEPGLTPETAVFDVARNIADSDRVILTLKK